MAGVTEKTGLGRAGFSRPEDVKKKRRRALTMSHKPDSIFYTNSRRYTK